MQTARPESKENHRLEQELVEGFALLPAEAHQFGLVAFLDGLADAEIGDQRPGWRHLEDFLTRSGSRIDTQPTPKPYMRAASQKV